MIKVGESFRYRVYEHDGVANVVDVVSGRIAVHFPFHKSASAHDYCDLLNREWRAWSDGVFGPGEGKWREWKPELSNDQSVALLTEIRDLLRARIDERIAEHRGYLPPFMVIEDQTAEYAFSRNVLVDVRRARVDSKYSTMEIAHAVAAKKNAEAAK